MLTDDQARRRRLAELERELGLARSERLDRVMAEFGFKTPRGRDLDSEAIALRFLAVELEAARRERRPVSRILRSAVLGDAGCAALCVEDAVERRCASEPSEEPEYPYDAELDLPRAPKGEPAPGDAETEDAPPDKAA